MPINEISAWVTYNGWALIKASVTSNHGPRTIFITRTIFASKADWSARKILFVGAVLTVTLGYGPRTAWHGCTLTVWSNDSQDSTGAPYDARTGIVMAPQGNLQFIHILRDPYGARAGHARVP